MLALACHRTRTRCAGSGEAGHRGSAYHKGTQPAVSGSSAARIALALFFELARDRADNYSRESMPSLRRTTPWLVVVLLLGGVASYRVFRHWGNRTNSPFNRPSHTPASAAKHSSDDEKTIKAFLALEAQRDLLDRTVWANELSAQKHEDVFVRLWDELRTNSDAFVTFQNLAFGVKLGTIRPGETVDRDHPGALRWAGRLLNLRIGKACSRFSVARATSSRIRMATRSIPPGTNAATSVFSVSLHVLNRTRQERIVLRGDVNVT